MSRWGIINEAQAVSNQQDGVKSRLYFVQIKHPKRRQDSTNSLITIYLNGLLTTAIRIDLV